MPGKVLVIDDSPTVRQQVRLALVQAGYEVVEASDGVDGFEQIRKGTDIKVVICDVNMPRMSGIEMLQKCQDNGGIKPSVVMLTTEGQPALVQQAKRLGAKGWIVKPFQAHLLVAAVGKLMAA